MCVISQETGFWFIFHHVPTGPSEGLYSPGYTEHTPMGQFTNNRAHSNYRVSLRMDRCWAWGRDWDKLKHLVPARCTIIRCSHCNSILITMNHVQQHCCTQQKHLHKIHLHTNTINSRFVDKCLGHSVNARIILSAYKTCN